MSGGYLGAPYNAYDPIGYNPFFGQQVTGTNFGFMPAPMSFTPFGMPNYMAMPDYMYNRGSYMNQSLLQPPMMQQSYNPFGSFNQPMMQPPPSPSQFGIGEPPPEFTQMDNSFYQTSLQSNDLPPTPSFYDPKPTTQKYMRVKVHGNAGVSSPQYKLVPYVTSSGRTHGNAGRV